MMTSRYYCYYGVILSAALLAASSSVQLAFAADVDADQNERELHAWRGAGWDHHGHHSGGWSSSSSSSSGKSGKSGGGGKGGKSGYYSSSVSSSDDHHNGHGHSGDWGSHQTSWGVPPPWHGSWGHNHGHDGWHGGWDNGYHYDWSSSSSSTSGKAGKSKSSKSKASKGAGSPNSSSSSDDSGAYGYSESSQDNCSDAENIRCCFGIDNPSLRLINRRTGFRLNPVQNCRRLSCNINDCD